MPDQPLYRSQILDQIWPRPTLLVKSRPLHFQEHRRALLHAAATVSLTFHCRM
jgi:hypothetical protein